MIINLNLNENKNYLIKFIKKKFKSENFEVIFIYIHYMFTSFIKSNSVKLETSHIAIIPLMR